MVKKVSAAEAKAHLSSLVAEVAFGGHRVVIERRGKALAALVNIRDLERLESYRPSSASPRGALALVGAWKDVPDADLDALLEDLRKARETDQGRRVELEA